MIPTKEQEKRNGRKEKVTKKTAYKRKYLDDNPWLKYLTYSRLRARNNGWEHTLTPSIVKEIWMRDSADSLGAPSLDRINPKKGYLPKNCRFIELSENRYLGTLGSIKKQAEQRKSTGKKCLFCYYTTNSRLRLCSEHKGRYAQRMKKYLADFGVVLKPLGITKE